MQSLSQILKNIAGALTSAFGASTPSPVEYDVEEKLTVSVPTVVIDFRDDKKRVWVHDRNDTVNKDMTDELVNMIDQIFDEAEIKHMDCSRSEDKATFIDDLKAVRNTKIDYDNFIRNIIRSASDAFIEAKRLQGIIVETADLSNLQPNPILADLDAHVNQAKPRLDDNPYSVN